VAKLAPSILAADFRRLGDEIAAAEAAGADRIHVDVMDGHFVPNISIGIPVLEACRAATRLPLDVHLMITAPERYLEAFVRAGADCVTVHAEATPHAHRAVQALHELGARAGLAINPATPLEAVDPLLEDLDLVLVMTVNPGFGGQQFIRSSLPRIKRLREWRDARSPACEIEVDGGINPRTAIDCVEAGADVLVAGTAVFAGGKVAENTARLMAGLVGKA
jgi:ribulose-phosphate 3-epimerase